VRRICNCSRICTVGIASEQVYYSGASGAPRNNAALRCCRHRHRLRRPRSAAPPPVCFRLSFCVRLPLFVGVMMSYEWGVCRIMTRVGRGQHTSTSVRRDFCRLHASDVRNTEVVASDGHALCVIFFVCAAVRGPSMQAKSASIPFLGMSTSPSLPLIFLSPGGGGRGGGGPGPKG
jgi:hypothetical protein